MGIRYQFDGAQMDFVLFCFIIQIRTILYLHIETAKTAESV